MLEIGMKAPEFALLDKDGNTVILSDFMGRKVVLYFYPEDNTPGCTRQACAFAAAYDGFKAKDMVAIGIRCLAGKEPLRQGLHGRGANKLHH